VRDSKGGASADEGKRRGDPKALVERALAGRDSAQSRSQDLIPSSSTIQLTLTPVSEKARFSAKEPQDVCINVCTASNADLFSRKIWH